MVWGSPACRAARSPVGVPVRSQVGAFGNRQGKMAFQTVESGRGGFCQVLANCSEIVDRSC